MTRNLTSRFKDYRELRRKKGASKEEILLISELIDHLSTVSHTIYKCEECPRFVKELKEFEGA